MTSKWLSWDLNPDLILKPKFLLLLETVGSESLDRKEKGMDLTSICQSKKLKCCGDLKVEVERGPGRWKVGRAGPGKIGLIGMGLRWGVYAWGTLLQIPEAGGAGESPH